MSRHSRFLFVVLLLVLGLSLSALADSRARIVRLSYVDGDVELDRRDGRGFITAFLNMPIIHGARVQTRDDSRAEIELEDGSTIRLTPNTILEFTELSLRSNGDRVSMVDLVDGTAYFDLRDNDHDFRLIAEGQQFTLRRSSHFRARTGSTGLDLAVFKGEVEVLSRNGTRVEVRKGESLSFDPDDTSRYYLARNTTEDRYDQWDREREEFRNRELRYAKGYHDGYRAGLYDLDYYGGWYTVASYGRVWRPHRVSRHWDPFGDGAWVYYPGYGYIWVSHHPWGWTPYRYGSWVYVSHHGWCWRPGNRWNIWAPVTVVINAPTGYRHPRPPAAPPTVIAGTTNNTNVVIPVGRGPRTGRDIDGDGNSFRDRTLSEDDGFGRNRRTPLPATGVEDVSGGTATGQAGSSASTGTELKRSGRPARETDNMGTSNSPSRLAGDSATSEGNGLGRATRDHSKSSDAPAPSDAPLRIERNERPSPVTPTQEAPPARTDRPARDYPVIDRAPSRPTGDSAPVYRPERTQRVEPAPQPQRTYTPPPSPPPQRTYSPPPPSTPAPARSAPAPAPAPSGGSRPSRTANPN